MEITEIRVRLVNNDTKLKAVASITLDGCLVIHDIKVIDGIKGLFISMPSRKTPDGTPKDIVHPIKQEVREQFSQAILAAYENELANKE